MSDNTQELKLNPAKLARLVAHLKDGGERSTEAAEKVLRMKKPNFVAAYIAEAMEQARVAPDETQATEQVVVEGAHGEKPTEKAPPATPEPTPAATPKKPKAAPAQTPTPDPVYRLVGDDGQSQKLEVMRVTDKAVILQLAPVTDMQKIFVGGELVEVDVIALSKHTSVDYNIGGKRFDTPKVIAAVNLARS
jgi:hypothetical protein